MGFVKYHFNFKLKYLHIKISTLFWQLRRLLLNKVTLECRKSCSSAIFQVIRARKYTHTKGLKRGLFILHSSEKWFWWYQFSVQNCSSCQAPCTEFGKERGEWHRNVILVIPDLGAELKLRSDTVHWAWKRERETMPEGILEESQPQSADQHFHRKVFPVGSPPPDGWGNSSGGDKEEEMAEEKLLEFSTWSPLGFCWFRSHGKDAALCLQKSQPSTRSTSTAPLDLGDNLWNLWICRSSEMSQLLCCSGVQQQQQGGDAKAVDVQNPHLGRTEANQNLLVPTPGWPGSHLHIPNHWWSSTASSPPSLAPAKWRFRILEKEILGFHSTQGVPGSSAAFPFRISFGFHLPQPYFRLNYYLIHTTVMSILIKIWIFTQLWPVPWAGWWSRSAVRTTLTLGTNWIINPDNNSQ